MFRIILALLLLTSSAQATQWRAGTGENTILGTSQAADIDYNSFNSVVKPIDDILSNYCNEYLQYASSSTLTVVAGTCVVSNSQGTIKLFLRDTANTTLTSSNLDTGSLTANTTYYVYSTAASNSTTTSTYYISASNTAPSGQTYYYQIGSFKTDTNTWITYIVNNNWNSYFGATSSKSSGVIYQALTDGQVLANDATVSESMHTLVGTTNPPTIDVCSGAVVSSGADVNCAATVAKGEYWEVTGANATIYFRPLGK